MIPKNLQGKMIFYFFLLLLITNGLFALVSFSRENLNTRKELEKIAFFIGQSLTFSTERYFESGDHFELENFFNSRKGLAKDLKITIYDKNWWWKYGDEERVPAGSFPDMGSFGKPEIRPGISQGFTQEIFFPVLSKGKHIGAIGIGVPDSNNLTNRSPGTDFFLMLILASILGISVAVIISRLIIKPLNALMEGIDAVREGNYSMRVKVFGSGELLKLGETFNRMASTVQETVKENLERNKILDEKLQELWEIYELTRSMSFSLKLDEILSVFLEKAQTLSFSSYGQIILKHKHTKKPVVMVKSEKDACVNVEDFERGLSRCFLYSKLVEVQSGDFAMIFFPLLAGSNVQGVLYLAKKEKTGYSENIKRFLETITPVGASMIENGRLYSQVAEINEYMKNVLGSVNTGVATLNRKNQFITANKAFQEILKIPGIDIVDLRIDEFREKLFDQNFALEFDKIITEHTFQKRQFKAQSAEGKTVERFQLIFNAKNGEMRTLDLRVIPLTEDRQIIGSVVVVEDITDLKKIEQQMLESEKWAVLGRLAASVAHEIRNPLVAIRSLVEIIGGEVEGEFKEHVSVVLGEVHRLNRVVAELLSLVRPESTLLKETDLIKLLNELNLLIRHESQKKGIKIQMDLPASFKPIKVDAEKIKQAFLNVFLNAIQALNNGGTIKVQLYEAVPGKIAVQFQDNGPGIKKEIQKNIFTPFFTTKDNGTGLGLAITKKIAELHGGKIELECPPAGGACFTFILPTGG